MIFVHSKPKQQKQSILSSPDPSWSQFQLLKAFSCSCLLARLLSLSESFNGRATIWLSCCLCSSGRHSKSWRSSVDMLLSDKLFAGTINISDSGIDKVVCTASCEKRHYSVLTHCTGDSIKWRAGLNSARQRKTREPCIRIFRLLSQNFHWILFVFHSTIVTNRSPETVAW